MGNKALRKLQFGREVTPGTKVAATALWRGTGSLDDQRETVFPPEDIGNLAGTDRTYVPKLAGALALESTPATFEQLPYIFNMGIKALTTGVDDGVGDGVVYAFPLHTTTLNTPQSFTVQGGDDQQAEVMEYALATDFTLEGGAAAALMMSANLFGRQIAPQAFTGGLTPPEVEEILFGSGKLFIDAEGGTIGTTQKSNTLLKMSAKVKTGLTPRFGLESLYFAAHRWQAPEVLLDLTFYHDASAVAEKAAKDAQTPRLIRLEFLGSTLGVAGSFTNKTLRIDLAGKWEKFTKLDEDGGDDIVTGTFRARFNSTGNLFAAFTVVNLLAALP